MSKRETATFAVSPASDGRSVTDSRAIAGGPSPTSTSLIIMRISGNTSLFATGPVPSNTSQAHRADAASTATVPAAATSRTYDFSNMAPHEMASAMNDLIGSGKMTFDESTSLVGMIPTALSKVQYDGTAPAAYGQKTDFLSTLKVGIEGAESRADEAGAKSLQSALDALTRLQGTPASVSSIHETA